MEKEKKTRKNEKTPSGTVGNKKTKKLKNYDESSDTVKSRKKSAEKDTKKEKKREKPSLLNVIMPYVLMILALFVVACFLFIDIFSGVSAENGVGVVGKAIRDFLCGMFGFGAFFVPVVLAILAVTWSKSVEKRCTMARVFYGIVSLVSMSTFIHVLACRAFKLNTEIGVFYKSGVNLDSGGVIGGYIGELCRTGLGLVGSVIVTVMLAVIFTIFLLGITPGYVMTLIKYKMKAARERKAAEREERRLLEEEEDREKELERIEAEKQKKREAEEEKAALARQKAEEAERKKVEKQREKEEKQREKEEKQREKEAADEVKEEPETKPAPAEEKAPVLIIPPKEEEPEKAVKAEEKKPVSDDMNDLLKEVFGNEKEKEKKAAPVAQEAPKAEPKENAQTAPKAAETSEETHNDPLSSMKEIDDLETVDDIVDDEFDEVPVDIEPEEEVAEYVFPPIDLLAEDTNKKDDDNTEELRRNAQVLMDTLRSFNVKIKEITYSRGPTITRYELKPDVGVRVRSIANLVDDIALNLATTGVRIEAPIPGKPAVGIEVPNENPTTVYLRSLIDTERFVGESSKLTACLGADVGGKSVYFNIAKMPHLLIAGATGMGKSVCINSIIVSLLYKARPDEVKLILIDPKKVEFNSYKDIPHLYCPIVSDPTKAAGALASAVAEMERRFALIEEVGVRNIFNYNEVTKDDPTKEFMPQMVIIIDELADLMMTAKDAVESSICRLAQKARAAGIHIIIGTQRPSVDVITGLIKANIPSRIACTVTSQVDSRTIIDIGGAERLIGKGDMLFAPVGSSKPMRVQGAFVSEFEVEKIVEFIKQNNCGAKYNEEFIKLIDEEAAKCSAGKKGAAPAGGGEVEGGLDPKFKEAVELAIDSGKVATSLLQRRLEVGYGRAAKIIDQMEQMGFVSAPDGNKPRKILISKEEFMQLAINDEI